MLCIMVDGRRGGYVRVAPGQRCELCGGDNSFRAAGTKWCYNCAKILNRRAGRARTAYQKRLVARDTVKDVFDCCITGIEYGDMFCRHCGQRLQGRGGYTYDTTTYEEGER